MARPLVKNLIIGGLSCIIWTLTLQTTIKYVILTLRADNRGEGGIFVLVCTGEKTKRWLGTSCYDWWCSIDCRWYDHPSYFYYFCG